MLNRLFSNPAFLALERAMDASAARAHLIAHNIANADTPNYKAKRLRFEEFLARELNVDAPMSELPLRQTHPDHLPGRTAYGSMVTLTSEGIIFTENSTTWRLDGNNVDIDHEMAEQAKNALQYSALSDLISRRLAGIRTAIAEGRR